VTVIKENAPEAQKQNQKLIAVVHIFVVQNPKTFQREKRRVMSQCPQQANE
jgi:hypothetical protein